MATLNPPAVTMGTYIQTTASLPHPQPGTYAARILQRKMTRCEERPETRLTDMKLLCLGQPRTGTTSLRKALYILGYNDVYHMINLHEGVVGEYEFWHRAFTHKLRGKGEPLTKADWDQAMGYCEAIVDVPPAAFPEEMLASYPEAKILITVRDTPEAWAKSMRETLGYARELGPFHNRGLWQDMFVALAPLPLWPRVLRLILEEIMGPNNEYFDAHATEMYNERNAKVRRLAHESGREVLEFNVKDGWAPLCEFLGKEIPNEPFPRSNDTAEWRSRAEMMSNRNKQALASTVRRGLIGSVSAAGVLATAFVLWKRYSPRR